MAQAEGLAQRLAAAGTPLPVFVGMRNWHPYLADTLAADVASRRPPGGRLHRRRAPQLFELHAVPRERPGRARRSWRVPDCPTSRSPTCPTGTTTRSSSTRTPHACPSALARLEPTLRDGAELVFTAHSIPESMAERYPYREQFEETARLVAERAWRSDRRYATVYQSRSGRPEDPWLGPDVCDYLREARARGLEAAVLSPVGFVCDHVEVLYDLDVEAARASAARSACRWCARRRSTTTRCFST